MAPSTAILLANLGSPEAPTPSAVRAYLAEFLGDPRVVDAPRWLWLPILYGIILATRPVKSAAKYAKIWSEEGSPLIVHTRRQAVLLKGLLGARGHADLLVDWAMRYGKPRLTEVLDRLVQEGIERILLLPLYPQYSASTTGSVEDLVQRWQTRKPHAAEIHLVRDYFLDQGYLAALAHSIRAHWGKNGRAEKLVMSFHGIPQRAVAAGDPYAEQCHATAKALAQMLELDARDWCIAFQSRFGPTAWLQPYTQATLEALAREGVQSVDVICPGFSADCLETLEEIDMECRAAFLAAGGVEFRYIPCLNERPEWIAALADLCLDKLAQFISPHAQNPEGARHV
ncbi:MAG: ferrochelatase [Rhodocyclaceae bacterium]|nr:ferrochelatase [Rhodocyclaceae bacterium]